jgi:hypothetical protein
MNGSGILVDAMSMARKGVRAIIIVTMISVGPVSAAWAQAPDAIDRATGLAEQPFNTLPMPAQPTEQYIPNQRVYVPQVGRQIDVPGHFAQRTPGGQIVEPPMTIPSPNGGPPVFLPGGAQP